MKNIYSSVVALVVFIVFASLAIADPGTTWENQIGQGRFQVLNQFGGAAVFDRETGRVWEQSPDTNTRNWVQALGHCYNRDLGGRKGWRLPTIEELASLVDTTQGANPALPAGHPFLNVQSSFYWSATANIFNLLAWVVDFGLGGAVGVVDKSVITFVWCVRGGQGGNQ
jgi:hypothetical protein